LGANPSDLLAPSAINILAITRRSAGAFAGMVPANNGEAFMVTKNSEAERQHRAGQRATSIQQRAMSIGEFCQHYGIGRTTAYEEIKRGRLRGLKVGKRTLITEDNAEDWLRRLPAIETGSVS
jgi:excisionase family DNA binding protein